MFHVLAMLWEEESHLSEAQREVRKAALDACKYQSSCNLIRQDEAKKAKKSLNIIHIGNIY
eukprot:CAMPEP_0172175934 /NCGR_PEP_ID=MMETSP1050-20130122/14516_1 /TAXON_ID=233186 /ORGANISM="Cryptomonas curvata, Strain CCAP979/52" /LENGTH=60 /DNA_ID=CAMNT_0012848117 /DNA_START=17 /DNA_END=199 /DNA_ORIENTATION=+